MYESNSDISTPKDETTIWRYMDLSKFLNILQNKSLFFPAAALFDDPFEGSSPVRLIKDRPRYLQGTSKPTLEQFPACMEIMKKWRYINCWHMNNYESAAMWKLYDKSGNGIAIVSTIGKLKTAIQNDVNKIYIGQVHYIDYETENFSPSNVLRPFFHKRISFTHEAELRALVVKHPPNSSGALSEYLEFQGDVANGITVSICTETLISNIIISPESPGWFYSLVRDLVKDKFSLNINVKRSDLLKDPLF